MSVYFTEKEKSLRGHMVVCVRLWVFSSGHEEFHKGLDLDAPNPERSRHVNILTTVIHQSDNMKDIKHKNTA